MSLADEAFSSVLLFYEKKIAESQKAENIFTDHLFVMNFLAKDSGIEIKDNLPQVSEHELNKFNKSKLIIKDQWASHPSTEDRIKMLEKTRRSLMSIDNEPANSLFTDIERTQRELTDKMFREVAYQGESSAMPSEIFQSEFISNFLENTFPKVYNGYYDNKNPLFFDVHKIGNGEENSKLEDLFSEDKIDMIYTAIALQNDIETIKQISDKAFKIKTFDYDGVKYRRKDSKDLLQKLEIELEQLNEQIKYNDIKIFQFFKTCESDSKNKSILENLYNQFFNYDKEFDSKYEIYTKLSNDLHFINYTTPFEQIRANLVGVEATEKKLKRRIRELLEDSHYQAEITKEMKDNFDLYLSKNWKYFGNEKYFDSNLEILFTAMNNYAFLLSRGYFLLKKNLLNYQVELIKITHNTGEEQAGGKCKIESDYL